MFYRRLIPTVLLCFSLYPIAAIADNCLSEEEAAIQEDLKNALSLAEELGIDLSDPEGEAAIETLMAGSCNNVTPVLVCIPFHGCFKYCPAPTIPCTAPKVCRLNTRQTGCSCQPPVTPTSGQASGSRG